MYVRRSRQSVGQRARLMEHFVAGTTARAAAELVGVHRNTAASFYTRLREVIAEEMEKSSRFAGEVEVDESYFGGGRKGKRGRGAAGKVRPVTGFRPYYGGHAIRLSLSGGRTLYPDAVFDLARPDGSPVLTALAC